VNWRASTYFLGHRLLGTDLEGMYNEARRVMQGSPEDARDFAARRLEQTLTHARSNIPYYRDRTAGPTLAEFPILTKDKIRTHFDELKSPVIRSDGTSRPTGRLTKWVEVTTGGSTGVPTRVIHGQRFREEGRVGKILANALCGFPLGTPYAMLWGSMADINSMKSGAGARVQSTLFNAHVLNAFRMTQERMRDYAVYLRESGVKHMMAYADAAGELARFVVGQAAGPVRLDSVMLCAGTVTEELRSTVQEAFGGTAHNKYGSRECGDMAVECARGGFHIFTHRVHLEVVDAAGNPAPHGTMGRILVTLLGNDEFPLIRYDIGDWGALRDGLCSCGSAFPMLDRIEGRTYEVIRDTKGGFVTPVYFRHLLGVVHPLPYVRRFQFIQQGERLYDLMLEISPKVPDETVRLDTTPVIHDLQAILGGDAEIRLRQTEHIQETGSGKFLYTKNLFKSTLSS
jgi:phenylacetate-CoA ligase